MDDTTDNAAASLAQSSITRRRLVRTAGTTVWAAPVVALAAAAPAYALGSATMPMVAVSNVLGRHPTTADAVVDVSITFTNNGTTATSLSAVVNIRLLQGAFTEGASMVTPGWTASMGTPSTQPTGGFDYTFTRAAGIDAGATEVLTFRFLASTNGTGTITVAAPVTTPTGTNTGSAGAYA